MNSTVFLCIIIFSAYIFILVFISLKFSQRAKTLAIHRNDTLARAQHSTKVLELELIITLDEETKVGYAETIVKNQAPGEIYNYAFYLIVDGERKTVRWHEPSSKFEFQIPDTGTKKEVIAFVKDENNQMATIRKHF